MGGPKVPSEVLIQESEFWGALTGSLDVMRDDARQAVRENREQWGKNESELALIREKMAVIEKILAETKKKQTASLLAAVQELEALRQNPPALRRESFTHWWEGFDGVVQKLTDIAARAEK